MIKLSRTVKLWAIILPLLAVANGAWYLNDFIGWSITLAFFLLVPGYLVLRILGTALQSRWETFSFSTGLSVLVIILGGLVLNSIHVFGVMRPLTNFNVYLTLDIVTICLLILTRKITVSIPRFHTISVEPVLVSIALTLLPLLAISGAIRLNNGASNILTMAMFAAIAALFVYLQIRKNLSTLYPYAVLTMGLAVLFSTSLRGLYITGHDIQHEYRVFQIVSSAGFWNSSFPKGDPYNACLSITLLPTMLGKLISASPIYMYKTVFQIIFAVGLIPIYSLIKRLSNKRIAFTSAIVFISFPPFFNDLPFLNRQELAFVFFGLLLLTTFMKLKRRAKTVLTILSLVGIILSHYSSGYVALSMLILALPAFLLLRKRYAKDVSFDIPTLRPSIIIAALLFTFIWNSQITASTGGLRNTVVKTFQGIWGDAQPKSTGTSYSLFSAPKQNPTKVLDQYADNNADKIHYVPPPNMSQTKLGSIISHAASVRSLNNLLRSFAAKILQVLLLIGLCVGLWRIRKKPSVNQIYIFSLGSVSVILLTLMTILPQLSADYSVTRLFQQTLVVTAVFIVIGANAIFSRFKRTWLITSIFIAALFLDLSGFIPQLTGGYPAQLALNNSGTYYNIYYLRPGEVRAANWLENQKNITSVAADMYDKTRFPNYPFTTTSIVNPAIASPYTNYLYQDYANKHLGINTIFLNGDVIDYTYDSPLKKTNLVYASQDAAIYGK